MGLPSFEKVWYLPIESKIFASKKVTCLTFQKGVFPEGFWSFRWHCPWLEWRELAAIKGLYQGDRTADCCKVVRLLVRLLASEERAGNEKTAVNLRVDSG
jgi:hypothetical protein